MFKLAQECNKVSRCNRTGKLVLSKIQYIEKSWKRAHDWAQETGQGVLETDPHGFEEAVMKYCRFYYVLLDVMQDRASSKALLTSDELDLEEDDNTIDSDEVSVLSSSSNDFVAMDQSKKRKLDTEDKASPKAKKKSI